MRAKMQCHSVAETKDGTGAKYTELVELWAVYGKDGSSNASWSKATPSGRVSLTISNPAAFGHFKPGGYYFVDFFDTTEDA
jgi:hypothetical protein